VLVEVIRSGVREGAHHGSVVLLDADGTVVHSIGDVTGPMFPRSSNKPIQALGMLRAGLELADDADLAVVCASHNGEAEHVRRVLGILGHVGLTEDDLRCPPDLPIHEPTAHAVLAGGGEKRRVYMNCSGKHSGMLATCVRRGWSLEDYLDPEHPLQREIARTLAELAGEPVGATAVDGCGAPLLGVSLTGLARAFAQFPTAAPGTPQRRIADAMRAHPYLVAGTDREDTRLMSAVPGLMSKVGAEGVYAAAMPDGRAVALKIDDGAVRARVPVMVASLRALGVDEPGLDELAEEPVLGGGEVVGTARVIPGTLEAP
jgi:L-asparaginase II